MQLFPSHTCLLIMTRKWCVFLVTSTQAVGRIHFLLGVPILGKPKLPSPRPTLYVVSQIWRMTKRTRKRSFQSNSSPEKVAAIGTNEIPTQRPTGALFLEINHTGARIRLSTYLIKHIPQVQRCSGEFTNLRLFLPRAPFVFRVLWPASKGVRQYGVLSWVNES